MKKIMIIMLCSVLGFVLPFLLFAMIVFLVNTFNVGGGIATISYEEVLPYLLLGGVLGTIGGIVFVRKNVKKTPEN